MHMLCKWNTKSKEFENLSNERGESKRINIVEQKFFFVLVLMMMIAAYDDVWSLAELPDLLCHHSAYLWLTRKQINDTKLSTVNWWTSQAVWVCWLDISGDIFNSAFVCNLLLSPPGPSLFSLWTVVTLNELQLCKIDPCNLKWYTPIVLASPVPNICCIASKHLYCNQSDTTDDTVELAACQPWRLSYGHHSHWQILL